MINGNAHFNLFIAIKCPQYRPFQITHTEQTQFNLAIAA